MGSDLNLLALPPSPLPVQAILKGSARNPYNIRKELVGKLFPRAEEFPFAHLMGGAGGDGGNG